MTFTAAQPGEGDLFSTAPPDFDLGVVAQFVLTEFGIDGRPQPLASERDQNVRIVSDQRTVVVKIANRAEQVAALDLQNAALRHIESIDPGLAVPRVVLTRDGADLAVLDGHLVRCVSHLPGRPLAAVPVADRSSFEPQLGQFVGRLSAALVGFAHPAAHRPDFLWNLDAAQQRRRWAASIADAGDRALVEAAFDRHRDSVVPMLPRLRVAVVHQDANDHNVLVDGGAISGLIDFGDMVVARQISELAVALTYALLDCVDVVATAHRVIAAYTDRFALLDDELQVVFDLVIARLASSVTISSHRHLAFAGNEYLLVSQAPALRLLQRLMALRPQFLHFVARDAAGLQPVPRHDAIVRWLHSAQCSPVQVLPFDLSLAPRVMISLAAGAPGTQHAADPIAYQAWLHDQLSTQSDDGDTRSVGVAVGAYDEDRSCYDGDQFASDAPEPRSVHLGLDLFVDAGTEVRAMLPGRVLTVVDNDAAYDYGPTVIVEHQAGDSGPFWCLYGHLARRTLDEIVPGHVVQAGDAVGWIGDHTVNGGWAPHVHLQLITDLMADPADGPNGNFEGAGEPSRMRVWRSISPSADLLVRLAPETFDVQPDADSLIGRRRNDLGASLSISYRRPLSIVRGRGARLIDHSGRAYIDCVNNVCHVGHAHPHVVAALTRQAATLNTNTRYLHPTILEYAERLASTFPAPLEVVYFVNSGSEANELALRLARTHTGRHDVVAVDWGYHGNTNALIEISAYKFNRRGGTGRSAHVHLADLPDTYRGPHRNAADAGRQYAASVASALDDAERANGGAAAFIAESISGCGGQVIFPDGYLHAAYGYARAAGALCIADEVQVGFGRVGSAMWAFQLQSVVPDIVTLGKPMGNGHPLAAVVTTREIANSFANGMEWFNTFGGNPVSCAVGMAVMDVIANDGLMQHAQQLGALFVDGLRRLQARHDSIGDVRGVGLFMGIDLVEDRNTRRPATALAADVVNEMRERGVLISSDGPADNVLKIKPPLVIDRNDVLFVIEQLDATLTRLAG